MEKTVFVNGTFDILHVGHYRLLNFAKAQGTKLYVAIDSDERVKELKGVSRPINCMLERVEALSNLKAVDFVLVFKDNKELEQLVKTISPDVMIVGGDWRGKHVIGSQFAKELKFFERIDGYSTTQKIQLITNRG